MPVALPVVKLAALCDPFLNPWTGESFVAEDVHIALARGELNETPFESNLSWTLAHHISRIAWLVKHGWDTPVEVDVGVPSLGGYVEWMLTDGCHRLAAAIVLGHPTIDACVSGDVEYGLDLFGVAVSELA